MTNQIPSDEILATVEASAPRRWAGVGMLALLGFLLLWVAATNPPALHWQAFLIVLGGVSIWGARRMRRATEQRLELTVEGIRDSRGVVLVSVEDVEKIDRGTFAFKPSNGFMIRTKSSAARAWEPGLWWRLGRRLAIGGVTPGGQTKNMAEILSALVHQRDQQV